MSVRLAGRSNLGERGERETGRGHGGGVSILGRRQGRGGGREKGKGRKEGRGREERGEGQGGRKQGKHTREERDVRLFRGRKGRGRGRRGTRRAEERGGEGLVHQEGRPDWGGVSLLAGRRGEGRGHYQGRQERGGRGSLGPTFPFVIRRGIMHHGIKELRERKGGGAEGRGEEGERGGKGQEKGEGSEITGKRGRK